MRIVDSDGFSISINKFKVAYVEEVEVKGTTTVYNICFENDSTVEVEVISDGGYDYVLENIFE